MYMVLYKILLLGWTIINVVLSTPPVIPLKPSSNYSMKTMIRNVNKLETTWKAGENFDSDFTEEYVTKLLGVLPSNRRKILPLELHRLASEEIPKEFDAGEKWPNCPTIKQIRDQSMCGSCWAFGAVEAISDRICIHSKGAKTPCISAEDLLTCCGLSCGMGCLGGYPDAAWRYWVHTGIVTGGDYGSDVGCQPYTIKPCHHHQNNGLSSCSGMEITTPRCKKKCQKHYNVSYKKDRFKGKKAYRLSNSVTQLQTEIMTNGPIEVTYTVYADFSAYKSGVYQHVSGKELGHHAVKMLGWGEENEVPYWLCANSWGDHWGDKGFFKIIRGKDECGIESGAVAGLP